MGFFEDIAESVGEAAAEIITAPITVAEAFFDALEE